MSCEAIEARNKLLSLGTKWATKSFGAELFIDIIVKKKTKKKHGLQTFMGVTEREGASATPPPPPRTVIEPFEEVHKVYIDLDIDFPGTLTLLHSD